MSVTVTFVASSPPTATPAPTAPPAATGPSPTPTRAPTRTPSHAPTLAPSPRPSPAPTQAPTPDDVVSMAVTLTLASVAVVEDVTEGAVRAALVGKLGGADPMRTETVRSFEVALAARRRLLTAPAARQLRGTVTATFLVFGSLSSLGFAVARAFELALSDDLAAAVSDGSLTTSLRASCGCELNATGAAVAPTRNFPTLRPTRRASVSPLPRPTQTPSLGPSEEADDAASDGVADDDAPSAPTPGSGGTGRPAAVATSALLIAAGAGTVACIAACIVAGTCAAKPRRSFAQPHIETLDADDPAQLFGHDDDLDGNSGGSGSGPRPAHSPSPSTQQPLPDIHLSIPEVPFRRTQRFRAAVASARAMGSALAPPRTSAGDNGARDGLVGHDAQEAPSGPSSGATTSTTLRSQSPFSTKPRGRSLYQMDRLCSICLCDLDDDDVAKELACSHFYHAPW